MLSYSISKTENAFYYHSNSQNNLTNTTLQSPKSYLKLAAFTLTH